MIQIVQQRPNSIEVHLDAPHLFPTGGSLKYTLRRLAIHADSESDLIDRRIASQRVQVVLPVVTGKPVAVAEISTHRSSLIHPNGK